MWLGEQINEYGIGNGISLIIFVNIISRAPDGASALYGIVKAYAYDGKLAIGILILAAIVVVFVAVIMFVIWVTGREKDSCAVCQESGWKENVWRPEHTYPNEGECGRRYPHHLCHVHTGVLPHHYWFGGAQYNQQVPSGSHEL